MLGMLLILVPAALGQHFAGGHSGGFGGGRPGGFSGGGFHSGFSATPAFHGSFAPTPRGFGAAPRMNWTVPRFGSIPQRGAYSGYRPSLNAGNRRGWDNRGRYRRPYFGYGYPGYPYGYVNSWQLLPWDIGYPDFTGYGDDDDSAQPNSAQAQPPSEEQLEPPQQEEGYRPEYSPAPYEPPANETVASPPPQNEPKLTLIFKDGHTQAIRNYMLTRTDIIVMDDAASGREPRIPLAELNLPATEQAAKRDGLDFSPPSA